MSRQSKLIFLSLLLLLISGVKASAQTTRVYVANSGNDANQCTASAPCKTVIKALTVVDPGGEAVITESGDYDKFVVTKSVTVSAAPGVNAGIVATGAGYAIVVVGLTTADTVAFRNLNLKGIAAPDAPIGISNSNAGTMYVDGCTLTGFDNAIVMSNTVGQLFVHDTVIRNSLFGIGLIGPQGEGVFRVVIDHCKLELNDTGIQVGSKVVATIRDTIASNNTSRGIQVRSTGMNQRTEVLIDNCQLSHNTVGLGTSGTNGFAVTRLTRSTITNNLQNGVVVGANGIVYTLQNNTIAGNFPDVSGVLTPLQPK